MTEGATSCHPLFSSPSRARKSISDYLSTLRSPQTDRQLDRQLDRQTDRQTDGGGDVLEHLSDCYSRRIPLIRRVNEMVRWFSGPSV